jgi:putative transposase
MSSTHLSLHYHLVFSTKDHAPLMAKEWRPRLHAYMGGILRNINAVPEMIGGVEDHVHLLAGLPATECLSDVMRDLKSNSSRWVREEMKVAHFAWQEGYGAFTVSASQREAVRHYIEGQEEHHRTRTFKEEYLDFLEKSGVKYDPRYLW